MNGVKRLETDPHLKKWYKWRNKISYLSEQIFLLEPKSKSPIISVSKFILTSQLVEFQLKELLLTLGFNKWLKTGTDYISDPADFDKQRYTLGMLVSELDKYTNIIGVKHLKSRLKKLLIQRNQFVHGLFNSRLPVEKLQPLSIKGSTIGEKILNDMLTLERKINDKEDRYFAKIKKLKNPSVKEKLLGQIWVGKS